MPTSINIAAIDAGSNALRMAIVAARSPKKFYKLKKSRVAVRLGHNVFTQRKIDPATMRQAVKAFKHFADLMEDYEVEAYRAVATSASREAANGRELARRVREETGLELEIINGKEEARLIRRAVFFALGSAFKPRVMADLGGGSLEINWMNGKKLLKAKALPLGTVRLMETFDANGIILPELQTRIERHVARVLRREWGRAPDLAQSVGSLCGGNAETLAHLAPGHRAEGVPILDIPTLRDILETILRSSLEKRMRLFKVHRDRAEVMPLAAIVFLALAKWTGANQFLVPGVGVREGMLLDLAAKYADS